MDMPFDYNRFVVGNDFLSRKRELSTLTNLLRQKQHALLYDAPKTGKTSLVQQSFLNLQRMSYNFKICSIDLLNVRTETEFLILFARQIAASVTNTIDDMAEFSEKYIKIPEYGLNTELSEEQILDILNLPEEISRDYNTNVVVYIEDFQNILLFEDPDSTLKRLEEAWKNHTLTTYLIVGSQINAMKYIFEEVKYFYNFAEHVPLLPMETKTVTDHIIRTFLLVGRVVEQNLAISIYDTVAGHPWYVWQISEISFNMTKGYLNDKIIQEAVQSVISLHEPRFKEMMNGLSNYQVRFLRAVFDGVTRFSSSEILEKYKFNSSANVHRLREALKKKEILTFNEQEEPIIIDPLFHLWLTKYYFV